MIFDAIILAGGRSTRLGGYPKASLRFRGRDLLEHSLDAARQAKRLVIVGDPDVIRVSPDIIVTREQPPFGGPAAGIAAGLTALRSSTVPWVLILACDIPDASRAVPILLSHLSGDGAIATDQHGQDQYLLACYRREALTNAVGACRDNIFGMSVRALVNNLATTTVTVPAGSTDDIDTWDDATRLGITIPSSTHHH
ncbi:MAG: molybdenum cofactor guanylyltransferase [Rhodoglobus sp.]